MLHHLAATLNNLREGGASMAHSNVVQTILDNDGEFQQLSADQQHIWLVLCVTLLGGKSGLIQRSALSILARQSKRDIEIIQNALDQFIVFGWVDKDEDGNIWIRQRVKHRCNSGYWKWGAFIEAREFASKSASLSAKCIALHKLDQVPQPPPRGQRSGGPGRVDETGLVQR